MKDLCTHGRSVWCPDCERERHASSKREAKLSPYSKEAVLKREAEARANSNRVACPRCSYENPAGYSNCGRCAARLTPDAIPNRVPPADLKLDQPPINDQAEGLRLHATRNRVRLSEDELSIVFGALNAWNMDGEQRGRIKQKIAEMLRD